MGPVSFKDDHIFRMTDDTGMFQHTKFGVPDRTKGYTTDDNARALIMAAMLYEQDPQEKYNKLIYRYMSFLFHAQNGRGKFRNFMGYDRRFLEEEGSEDCFGRSLWALGFVIANESVPLNVKRTANYVVKKAVPNCLDLSYPRAKAYSIIGLEYIGTEESRGYVQRLASSLAEQYEQFRDEEWQRFENALTYSNAVLPWAMLVGYKATGNERFKEIGLESLKFLEGKTFRGGYFKPIGCCGWLVKGKERAEFDEQPVEACETVLAYLEAYVVTGEKSYLKKAKICFEWFEGRNSKGISLIDNETGGCYDGITQNGVNLNQGAESIISYVIANLALAAQHNRR